jgi:hypothetical protein
VYIPSKGRADVCLTAKCLVRDGVPFKLVIEAQEHDQYAERFGEDRLLVLPFANLGLFSARNWIKDHATEAGAVRHWQLDDNMSRFARSFKGMRYVCNAGVALRVCEDFTDRYENVAISGLNYVMFNPGGTLKPFQVNCRVYSCTLILNSLPYRWRTKYNDDTDICLQALAGGWCTILINAFLVKKMTTMAVKGGNTADLYQGDGRLKMARALERLWPRVVATKRRFGRPQHVVFDSWRRFDTPLKLRAGVDVGTEPNEYGLELNG